MAVHTPTADTYVTVKHFYFVKGNLTYLTLGIFGGRAAVEVGEK